MDLEGQGGSTSGRARAPVSLRICAFFLSLAFALLVLLPIVSFLFFSRVSL